jgi:LysR family transcriptional regulator for metE and metH
MKNTTLKQLRTFAMLARSRTMVAAAESLGITPPAVTIQLKLLEDSVGLPLVERTSTGNKLTAAGREVLTAAARVDQILSECGTAIEHLKGLEGGSATLGVVSTAQYFAPFALAAFGRAHPGIEVKLFIGNRVEIVDALEQYRVDIAIMGRPPDTLDVASHVLGDNPHVVIAAPGHRLAERARIPMSALGAETFLVREQGSGTRTLMEHRLAEANVRPRIGMEIASNETIKQAVMAGLGVAFLSAHTVAAEIADGRLVTLDVAGLPIIRQWFIVRHADRRLLPAADALLQFITAEGPAYLPVRSSAVNRGPKPRSTPVKASVGRD